MGKLAQMLTESFKNKDQCSEKNQHKEISIIVKYLILQARWNWNSIC